MDEYEFRYMKKIIEAASSAADPEESLRGNVLLSIEAQQSSAIAKIEDTIEQNLFIVFKNLRKLTRHEQDIVLSYFLTRKAQAQIANTLGTSQTNISFRMREAIARLGHFVANKNPGPRSKNPYKRHVCCYRVDPPELGQFRNDITSAGFDSVFSTSASFLTDSSTAPTPELIDSTDFTTIKPRKVSTKRTAREKAWVAYARARATKGKHRSKLETSRIKEEFERLWAEMNPPKESPPIREPKIDRRFGPRTIQIKQKMSDYSGLRIGPRSPEVRAAMHAGQLKRRREEDKFLQRAKYRATYYFKKTGICRTWDEIVADSEMLRNKPPQVRRGPYKRQQDKAITTQGSELHNNRLEDHHD